MLIGFIGDVHGQVFHAIAAILTWQVKTGRNFDLLVQVGDMGAYPDLTRVDRATARYLAIDPSQGDFSRLLRADGERAKKLRQVRDHFATPYHARDKIPRYPGRSLGYGDRWPVFPRWPAGRRRPR